MICNVTDCPNAATYIADLVIYASVEYLHPPAHGTIGVCVCTEHATAERAAELLTADARQKTDIAFRQARRAAPDWNRSFVQWKELFK